MTVFLDFSQGKRERERAAQPALRDAACSRKSKSGQTEGGGVSLGSTTTTITAAATISIFFKMMDDGGSPVVRYAASITECSSANHSGILSWQLHCCSLTIVKREEKKKKERLRGGYDENRTRQKRVIWIMRACQM
jgi:hypothetical protein